MTDRELCPIRVANILRLRVSEVARAMRNAGVDTQLSPKKAKGWRSGAEAIPEWLSALYADRMATDARREFTRRDVDLAKELTVMTRLSSESKTYGPEG